MRIRDVLGFALACLITGVLMAREFTQWEIGYISWVKMGLVILGGSLVLVGIRISNRPAAMMGFIITVFTTPFIFKIQDLTHAQDMLIFVMMVCIPLVFLLECVTALKAGKQDISLFRALLSRETKLRPYNYLPLIFTLTIVLALVLLLILVLNLPFTKRVIPSGGFLIWQILIFIGLSLLFTGPFIGPFTIRVKK